MKRSKSLDQVLSIDAIALNHIAKLHNKNKIQETILEKLVNLPKKDSDRK